MAEGKKHSLVQCRIEACQKIDEIVKEQEVSKKKAMKLLAGETGVPFGTLNYWYYRDDESNKSGDGKVQVTQPSKNTVESKSKVAAKIVKNINKALDKEEAEALADSSVMKAAKELADGLGGAVLKEELFELFLRAINKVDEIIAANQKLDDPINSDGMVDTILRQARNLGWKEPDILKSNTCNKCKVSSCPNRMCKNHVEKPKKKVTGKVKAKGEK